MQSRGISQASPTRLNDEKFKIRQSVPGYEILEQIGAGTYGNVFKVRETDANMDNVLVLKQVRLDGLTKEEQEQTTNEAQLMLSIDEHKNIVKHHVSFIESGNLNMVMEYCSRGDLAKLIRKTRDAGEHFSEAFIWQVFVQICQALHHLHSNRVLHRDIKPENIFLDENARVKVGDLGLGRLLSSQTRHAQSTVGTPLYFSPEVCREELYDERSDVWAFGCLIYQMATLRPPFTAKNAIALAQKIVKGPFEPLPTRYSSDLHFVVHRMLEKDPRDRPNTAQLLNYGPTKIHLMEDKMFLWKRQATESFSQREASLQDTINTLEKKLKACEEEMRQMHCSHDRVLEQVQRSEQDALRKVARLEDVVRRMKAERQHDHPEVRTPGRKQHISTANSVARTPTSLQRPSTRFAGPQSSAAKRGTYISPGLKHRAGGPARNTANNKTPAKAKQAQVASSGVKVVPQRRSLVERKRRSMESASDVAVTGNENTKDNGCISKDAKERVSKGKLSDHEESVENEGNSYQRALYFHVPSSPSPSSSLGPARRVPSSFVLSDEDLL